MFIALYFYFISGFLNVTEEPIKDIQTVLHLAYSSQFDSAMVVADQLPEPYNQLYQATVLQMKHHDMETGSSHDFKAFDQAIDPLISQLEIAFKTTAVNKLLGEAYFLKSSEEARRGNYFSALKFSGKGNDLLEGVLNVTNDNDVKCPLGLYKYYKSVKTKWIPFVSNEKSKGLRYLEAAYTHGTYTKVAALQQLIFLYKREGQLKKSIALAEEAIKAYPNSRIFLWAYGYCLQTAKEYKKALPVFQKLHAYYKQSGSEINTIETLYRIGKCHMNLNETKVALQYFKTILEMKKSEWAKEKLDEKLSNVKRYYKSLGNK